MEGSNKSDTESDDRVTLFQEGITHEAHIDIQTENFNLLTKMAKCSATFAMDSFVRDGLKPIVLKYGYSVCPMLPRESYDALKAVREMEDGHFKIMSEFKEDCNDRVRPILGRKYYAPNPKLVSGYVKFMLCNDLVVDPSTVVVLTAAFCLQFPVMEAICNVLKVSELEWGKYKFSMKEKAFKRWPIESLNAYLSKTVMMIRGEVFQEVVYIMTILQNGFDFNSFSQWERDSLGYFFSKENSKWSSMIIHLLGTNCNKIRLDRINQCWSAYPFNLVDFAKLGGFDVNSTLCLDCYLPLSTRLVRDIGCRVNNEVSVLIVSPVHSAVMYKSEWIYGLKQFETYSTGHPYHLVPASYEVFKEWMSDAEVKDLYVRTLDKTISHAISDCLISEYFASEGQEIMSKVSKDKTLISHYLNERFKFRCDYKVFDSDEMRDIISEDGLISMLFNSLLMAEFRPLDVFTNKELWNISIQACQFIWSKLAAGPYLGGSSVDPALLPNVLP